MTDVDASPPPRQVAFGIDKQSVLWIVEDSEYWRHVRLLDDA